MTNPPPVAPVEGHLYLLFTEYENTINIRKWSKGPFYGAQEYVPVGELERLRAALTKIAYEHDESFSGEDHVRAIWIARTALQGNAL